MSPVLTYSPEVRQAQPEQGVSSEPLSSSAMLTLLHTMRKEIEERDKQLKLQLQLKDEYMEAELKRRDQNLEEALKQRDEEWKSRWEQREEELSAELKASEDALFFQQLKRKSELFKIMKEIEDSMEKNMLQKVDAFRYLYKEHQKEIRALIEKNRQGIGGHP